MKKIIVLAAAFLVGATGLFAQTKAGKIDTTKHSIYYNFPGSYDGRNLNLSKKEALKMQVAKVYTNPVQVTNSNSEKCPLCPNTPNLSLKEKMKAEVVRLYTCTMYSGLANKSGKCPKCGMALTTK